MPPLPWRYLEAHAIGRAFDVPDLQRADFRHPQAGGIGAHQQRPSAQGSRGLNQAADFCAREDLRQTLRHLSHRNVEARLRAAEDAPEEKAEGARGLIDARVGELLVANQVQQVGLNLVTAAIVQWNTVYLERAANALRGHGQAVDDALLQYLSPLGWEHINLPGDYLWRSSAKIGAVEIVAAILAPMFFGTPATGRVMPSNAIARALAPCPTIAGRRRRWWVSPR